MSTADYEQQTPEQENPRRDFIRNSALVAGAAAAIGVASSASAQSIRSPSPVQGRQLTAVFDAEYQDKITRDEIWNVLEQMFDIAGCPNCGLVGFDLHLAVNPIYNVQSNIPVNIGLDKAQFGG